MWPTSRGTTIPPLANRYEVASPRWLNLPRASLCNAPWLAEVKRAAALERTVSGQVSGRNAGTLAECAFLRSPDLAVCVQYCVVQPHRTIPRRDEAVVQRSAAAPAELTTNERMPSVSRAWKTRSRRLDRWRTDRPKRSKHRLCRLPQGTSLLRSRPTCIFRHAL